ncbi:MAG TPA: sulfite exporter TauE/SafE family protein [Cellulomonas sp.]
MSVTVWLVLALAALLVGISKTAIAGVATVSVALYAAVLPAKESTGALLLLLLVGDVVAVSSYWRQADWRLLSRLMAPVVAGVLVGAVFLSRVDDAVMRRTIGAVLLALLAVHLVRMAAARRRVRVAPTAGAPRGLGLLYGSLAGFTTMVANSGGPVMNLYLLSVRVDKLRFLGTTACFFFAVNLFKVPFSVGLGLIHADALRTAAVLAPVVLLGTWIGRAIVRRVDQARFEWLVLAFTLVASLNLLR